MRLAVTYHDITTVYQRSPLSARIPIMGFVDAGPIIHILIKKLKLEAEGAGKR
jgi:hypothetical protein